MASDLFHKCPACELLLPAVENQRDERCPSCLMSEGRGVQMDLVTLTVAPEKLARTNARLAAHRRG